MKPKHLIVGAVMTAFSLLALAAPEAATPPASSAAATSAPTTAPKVAKAKSTKKTEQGKTRSIVLHMEGKVFPLGAADLALLREFGARIEALRPAQEAALAAPGRTRPDVFPADPS